MVLQLWFTVIWCINLWFSWMNFQWKNVILNHYWSPLMSAFQERLLKLITHSSLQGFHILIWNWIELCTMQQEMSEIRISDIKICLLDNIIFVEMELTWYFCHCDIILLLRVFTIMKYVFSQVCLSEGLWSAPQCSAIYTIHLLNDQLAPLPDHTGFLLPRPAHNASKSFPMTNSA